MISVGPSVASGSSSPPIFFKIAELKGGGTSDSGPNVAASCPCVPAAGGFVRETLGAWSSMESAQQISFACQKRGRVGYGGGLRWGELW